MRAIIIDDKDAIALLEQIELAKFTPDMLMPRYSLTDDQLARMTEGFHRRFHFIVTRWLQEHGARVIR